MRFPTPADPLEGPDLGGDLFTRQNDGSYRMRVGMPTEARTWRRRSQAQGTLFRMRGGQEFGVFSNPVAPQELRLSVGDGAGRSCIAAVPWLTNQAQTDYLGGVA